jgi:hypothetical protein
VIVFTAAIAMSVTAAAVSLLRGRQYYYEAPAPAAAAPVPAPASVTSGASNGKNGRLPTIPETRNADAPGPPRL